MLFPRDMIFILAAFLSGSVPWSYLIGRARGVDIRKGGSGNTGATNLLRLCGRSWGLLGLFLDAAKGALPVLAARYGAFGLFGPAGDWTVAAAAIAAVMGHVYSPWLGFRGGKGVATTLGVLLVLSPSSVLVGLAVFILVLWIFRYVSLGSILAAVAVIPSVILFEAGRFPTQLIVCLAAALIVFRHRSNIAKLLKGSENRFSFGGK